jgi:hypothetical protein
MPPSWVNWLKSYHHQSTLDGTGRTGMIKKIVKLFQTLEVDLGPVQDGQTNSTANAIWRITSSEVVELVAQVKVQMQKDMNAL